MKCAGRSNASHYRINVFLPLMVSAVLAGGCGSIAQKATPISVPIAATTKPVSDRPASAYNSPTVKPAITKTANSNTGDSDPVMTTSLAEHMLQSQQPVNISPVNLSQAVFFTGAHTKTKIVALTFDDGPDNHWTSEILDVLKQYNVRATFFLIGSHAQEYPNVVRRIESEGHAIGNHTWDHPQLTKMNATQVRNEIGRADETLYSILGFHPTVFRPPYGAYNATTVQVAKSLGYEVVNWSVDTRDWAGATPPQIMHAVSVELYPGGIILQHSSGGKNGSLKNTVDALREEIMTLRAEGYSFVTIPQMLSIPAERN